MNDFSFAAKSILKKKIEMAIYLMRAARNEIA